MQFLVSILSGMAGMAPLFMVASDPAALAKLRNLVICSVSKVFDGLFTFRLAAKIAPQKASHAPEVSTQSTL